MNIQISAPATVDLTTVKARDALEKKLHELIGEFNAAKDGTVVIPGEYLEVVVTKKC